MSNPSSAFKKAVSLFLDLHSTLEPKHETVSAVTGHPDGTVAVPYMDNYIYCRLQGDDSKVVRAFNTSVPNNVSDLTIDLEIIKDDQGRIVGYVVLGISKSIQYIVSPSTSTPISSLPPHHKSHEAARIGGGYDMVNVYEEAIVALRGNAQSTPSMYVNVSRGAYYIDGVHYYYAGGTSPIFTADGDSIDVLCIDSLGVLSIVEGTHGSWGGGAGGFGGGGSGTPAFPSIDPSLCPIAAINIVSTMTVIQESDFGIDPRPLLSVGSSSGTGDDFLLMGA